MMHFLRDDWILFFQETKHTIVMTNSSSHIICDDRIIINNTLLYSKYLSTILDCFSCVARVFAKHILSFKLSKCDFLASR